MPLLNRVSTCTRAIRSTGSSSVAKCSVSPVIRNDHARPCEQVVSAGSKPKLQSRAMTTFCRFPRCLWTTTCHQRPRPPHRSCHDEG
ncbi:uncharacterized protein BJ212DRAFT_210953 [Suillus subaureus]|uniref:Uncharacterized protein n=1 Tax=Suillus subaureus TaxID=48587 RepID=A0A9P7JDK5_9AGAM|nr:uncharacterized protein BJ212DRAFT_210953 [Suillus subaureus]KAG1816090.1 hypothetical protein BJ212DRAFT_210953 [Suillus subaureus]